MTYPEILDDVEDSAAVITLNRPEARNAFTLRMRAEPRHAAARADDS